MPNIFTGSEIVGIGVQIEKNGRDFYNSLAAKSRDKKSAGVFKYLAGEEQKHIKVFNDMLGNTGKYEPQEAYKGEYLAYMKALVGDYIFTKKDKGALTAEKIKTDKEAVDTGIGFEKDSILFYEGMKNVVPDYDKKTVQQLVEQEQSHLKQLLELKHGV